MKNTGVFRGRQIFRVACRIAETIQSAPRAYVCEHVRGMH
jgi:hypothetical protein